MYAKSHLIICRAGAATVAELAASARPAILIPYPHVRQTPGFNALALKEVGMAKIIGQQNLSGKSLSEAILETIEHPEELAQVWPSGNCPEEKMRRNNCGCVFSISPEAKRP